MISPISFLLFNYVYDKSSNKVRTFWETHKIWKNLHHGFDKSADLLSKRQNHEEDFFKLCVLPPKSPNFRREGIKPIK